VTEALLSVNQLSVDFKTAQGPGRAVDRVSFDLGPGESLGLAGESGCGKTVTALSILGLLDAVPARIAAGSILFAGRNLLTLNPEDLRRVRGKEIAMIFQEPVTCLNPVLPIGRQVAEPLAAHFPLTYPEACRQAVKWLQRVRLPDPERRFLDYPHQLSGGMCQRVMIAMAMVCRPRLLIADEPTTALDATIQSQILDLIQTLIDQQKMSLLLITHDLGLMARMVSRVMIMYAGQIVEQASALDLFEHPFHPYTVGLLASIPRRCGCAEGRPGRLSEIPGRVPAITERISGCKFSPRCLHAFDLCREKPPELFDLGSGHGVRCWLKLYPKRRHGLDRRQDSAA
jgi:peptide/nickel transport system ATP-binding protein